jgi:hypothetical protein
MNEPNSRTWSYEMGRGVQTSHGRGRWFDPSIAHLEKVDSRLHFKTCYSAG